MQRLSLILVLIMICALDDPGKSNEISTLSRQLATSVRLPNQFPQCRHILFEPRHASFQLSRTAAPGWQRRNCGCRRGLSVVGCNVDLATELMHVLRVPSSRRAW